MPSPSEPGRVPTVVGVPVISDPVHDSRDGNSGAVENHSDHTAVTRLVPLLKRLAVGSKIPTAFQAAHIRDVRDEGSSSAITVRREIPIIILPPSVDAQMQARARAARVDVAEAAPDLQVEPAKPSRFMRPVVAGLAVLAMVMLGGVLVKKQSAHWASADAPHADVPHAVAPVVPEPAAPELANAAAAAVELPPSTEPAPAAGACTVAGKPKAIGAQAILATGIEVAPSPRGIVLGFASRPLHAVSMLVDPTTVTVAASRTGRSAEAIRRVTPIPGAVSSKGQRPKFAVSTDHAGDVLATRRTSSGASPIDLGVAAGHLVWAPHETNEAGVLWPLAGADAPVEGLRSVPLEPSARGYAVAFRRGSSIWTGFISAKGSHRLSPLGNLVETKALGPEVGSPSVAVSGDTVLVAWADRANRKDGWGLRYRTWHLPHAGEAVAEAQASTFEVPAGGLGAPFIAPAVTPLAKGRFLLLWTEGPPSGHRVRGVTLDAAGHPQGEPLVISDEGENAGQAQAAIQPDGHGMVAYLAASPQGFKVMGTSITCR